MSTFIRMRRTGDPSVLILEEDAGPPPRSAAQASSVAIAMRLGGRRFLEFGAKVHEGIKPRGCDYEKPRRGLG
jgi:hypothetical protein